MGLTEFSKEILPVLEQELKRQVQRFDGPGSEAFYEMLSYHMGWAGEAARAGGKRIRPLLMLLVVTACGGEWLRALSAAAAIELLHNFSLVHDDIEDHSPVRHGRGTLWKLHGIPMAINAGDALFAISNAAVLDALAHYPAEAVLQTAASLHAACLQLTRGQYLDMSYEKRTDLKVEDYWPMVEGKTAALLSASAEMGAILGGATPEAQRYYAGFGHNLGLAFQVQDDMLGIWGDESVTGKSAGSDLVEGKNSLPVLYGVAHSKEFAERWASPPIALKETSHLAQVLKDAGAYDYCEKEAARLTALAMESLRAANSQGDAGAALAELADKLLHRSD
jgi:geranylgeranyl diphosphate synthase, type I